MSEPLEIDECTGGYSPTVLRFEHFVNRLLEKNPDHKDKEVLLDILEIAQGANNALEMLDGKLAEFDDRGVRLRVGSTFLYEIFNHLDHDALSAFPPKPRAQRQTPPPWVDPRENMDIT